MPFLAARREHHCGAGAVSGRAANERALRTAEERSDECAAGGWRADLDRVVLPGAWGRSADGARPDRIPLAAHNDGAREMRCHRLLNAADIGTDRCIEHDRQVRARWSHDLPALSAVVFPAAGSGDGLAAAPGETESHAGHRQSRMIISSL
jgi:hypothetical protein